YSNITNLIIICCHAIFLPDISSPFFPLHSVYDESNWNLALFQRSNPVTEKPSEHLTFLSHILAGLDTLSTGIWAGNTILIFSGGATARHVTELSEARSYYHAAISHSLSRGENGWGRAGKLHWEGRLLLEEQATDSFQNLLFSIALFRQKTGHYPSQIRIITHAFKASRFLELHAPAIRWPARRIRVQGINPIMTQEEYTETVSGEEQFGYLPFLQDPFGNGKVLSKKRMKRGWDEGVLKEVGEGLERSVKALLRGEVVGRLPWEE
ncbi:hypothetical protein K432DRAFT_277321, partial [Lepidopterella palustris CBS 459.81]